MRIYMYIYILYITVAWYYSSISILIFIYYISLYNLYSVYIHIYVYTLHNIIIYMSRL